jgi:hypothetical protein
VSLTLSPFSPRRPASTVHGHLAARTMESTIYLLCVPVVALAQRVLDALQALVLLVAGRGLGALSLALALDRLPRAPQRLLRVGLATAAL